MGYALVFHQNIKLKIRQILSWGKIRENFPRSGKGIVSQDISIRFCYNNYEQAQNNLEQRQM
jgi:hypothetical protein